MSEIKKKVYIVVSKQSQTVQSIIHLDLTLVIYNHSGWDGLIGFSFNKHGDSSSVFEKKKKQQKTKKQNNNNNNKKNVFAEVTASTDMYVILRDFFRAFCVIHKFAKE